MVVAVPWIACTAGEPGDRDVLDIQEAAVRWALADSGISFDPTVEVCLLLGSGYLEWDVIGDPPPSFMRRFTNEPRPVRLFSECSPDGHVEFPIVTTTGKHGVVVEYGPVTKGPDGAFLVPVGYLKGPGWGSVWECEVTRTNGDWQVERCPVAVEI